MDSSSSQLSVYWTPNTCDEPSPIESLSDEEVLNLVKAIDKKNSVIGAMPELDIFGPAPVYLFKPYSLVAKYARTDHGNEAYIMEYVRQHTSIPLPRVHRVLQHPSGLGIWIIMDYVEGDCLLVRWHTLSWWRRLQIIFALRSYIQQLHNTPLPHPDVPGPFDSTGQPLPCEGSYFDEGSGPFPTYADFITWHDHQHHRAQIAFHSQGRGDILRYLKFDPSWPLVLCHFDLHVRNILVDKDNRVWLIDWAFAGAYPPWFEYIALASWANAANYDRRLPRSFAIFIDFIVGGYGWYYKSYITPLVAYVEMFQHRVIDDEYFVKLGLDPVLWRPSNVARPPSHRRIAQRILDTVYDGLLTLWTSCVGI